MKAQRLLLILIPFFSFSQGNPTFTEANIDDVYTQFNLSGENVVFVSIERGVDYTHPAYLNSDGTTRIAYIYDMVNPAGASDSGNPYGRGTIFTEADINAALSNGGTPITNDRQGHGTACIGITAGNGGGTAGLEFKGVAPSAKLIVVKMIQDGFPPHGMQAGESGYFDPTDIPIALQFVHDKINELGLPAVTLMNFGSIGGPTDGTSTISRAMDDFINQGHILLCGVGDDGGADNHAAGIVTTGVQEEILVNKGETGNLRFDLWYSEEDRFDITIEDPSGTQFGPYAAPATSSGATNIFQSSFYYYQRGADVDFFGATSNRREILIDFINSGPTGIYKVIITPTSVMNTGEFHASLNPSLYSNNNAFLSHIVPGYSMNDYASAFNVIVPGDYVVDNSWTDINGVPRSLVGQGNPGEIWIGSSAGLTYDDRQAIDFASPGEVLFAPYSLDSYYGSFPANQVQGGNGFYGIQNAVSAAAPVACGVIALMLELDPSLSNQDVKDILNQTAKQDGFTGSVPNFTWGFGKMDALAAVQEVNNRLSVEDFNDNEVNVFPNPVKDKLSIDFNGTIHTIDIYGIEGKLIKSISDTRNEIDVSELGKGMYILKLKTDNAHKLCKFLKV
ncbi:S8/S53 family peptidase [Winogradskyella sp.]|uniref:S8/S53 family peptidase n=1 Tax=Winogradskyella sp. TaxID=1883156 RepID=UPI003BAD87C5